MPANFWGIVAHRPQYNSVRYLGQLLDRLAAAGFRPRTVYMDVDWTYNIAYILEVLRRHAADLRQRGVQLGINVVEASIGDQDELYFAAHTLTRRTVADATPNTLYESTLRAIVALLDDAGLNTPDVVLRVGSWSHRPYERGDEVDEVRPGSLAHGAVALADAL